MHKFDTARLNVLRLPASFPLQYVHRIQSAGTKYFPGLTYRSYHVYSFVKRTLGIQPFLRSWVEGIETSDE